MKRAITDLRTHRLDWQSRLLVIVIPPLCAGMVAACAWKGCADARTAVALSVAIALAAWLLRAATPAAALSGGILSAAILLRGGPPGRLRWLHSPLAPLMVLFLLTLAATRFHRREKERLGVGEDRRGRGAAQVVANLGVAALAGAVLTFFAASGRAFLWSAGGAVMLVSALAEATADTLSSELGAVLGGRPFLVTTRRQVPVGTDGAVSAAGALAGFAGAVAVVFAALPTLGLDWTSAAAAGLGAIGGLFFDSLLGATLEQRGWLNNDAVNFLSTLAAALLSLGLLRCFSG